MQKKETYPMFKAKELTDEDRKPRRFTKAENDVLVAKKVVKPPKRIF